MPKTPPLLLPPCTDQSKQTLFSKNNDLQADDDELIEWDSFERLEREYEETYMTDNAKTVSSFFHKQHLHLNITTMSGSRKRLL